MQPYPEAIEQTMRKFYQTLSEKDQRRYAAMEAMKLGHGGISYMAQVLGCTRQTVANGIRELEALPEEPAYDPRIRQPGAGRRPCWEIWPGIDAAFLQVVEDHTAGSPCQEEVRWTDLTLEQIAERLAQDHGMPVSLTVVQQLLDRHHFVRRQAQKKRP